MSPKPRSKNLKRNEETKESFLSILIVCEGEETECIYYSYFRVKHRLSKDIINIKGRECGTDPKSVVEYAIKLAKSKKRNEKFKNVFCVVDKDSHLNLSEAIELANNNDVKIILSNPCFEYWLLLHLKEYNRPAHNSDELESEIKEEKSEYHKSNKKVIEEIADKYQTAIANVIKIKSSRDWSNLYETNPSTNAYKVVEGIDEVASP